MDGWEGVEIVDVLLLWKIFLIGLFLACGVLLFEFGIEAKRKMLMMIIVQNVVVHRNKIRRHINNFYIHVSILARQIIEHR